MTQNEAGWHRLVVEREREIARLQKENADLRVQLEQQQRATAEAQKAALKLLQIWNSDNCQGLDELLEQNPWLRLPHLKGK
jgi:hypothetical protein